MRDPDTALGGLRSDGYVSIREDIPRGMIQLKGDIGSSAFRDAVRLATGANFPAALRISDGAQGMVAWMAPDEVLIFTDLPAVPKVLRKLEERLSGLHHLALDVSAMRATLRLDGALVREVLAKLAPLEMATMTAGDFRRTRLAQVPAAVWLSSPETAHVICFRSVSRYVFDLLDLSARKGGEIGVF